MIAVVISLFAPYIREYCTVYLFVHLAVASIGLNWIFHDLLEISESIVRRGANFALDQLVLDDLLRAIYHPINGLWACCVGTYLGASSMYGLQMTDDDKTELLQSSLYLKDKSQAQAVLLKAGGCKALLPESVQNWLQQSSSSPTLEKTIDISVGLESDKSTSDSDVTEVDEHDQIFRGSAVVDEDFEKIGELSDVSQPSNMVHSFKDERMKRLSGSESQQEAKDPTGWEDVSQTDPVEVFFRILRKMAMDRIRSYAEALPRSQIENVGIVASMALGIRLSLRRASYDRAPLLCAGIAALSFGTIISREAILGNIYNKQSMHIVCKDIASSILDKLKKRKYSSKKTFFAMVTMLIFCRRKQGNMGAPRNSQSFKTM